MGPHASRGDAERTNAGARQPRLGCRACGDCEARRDRAARIACYGDVGRVSPHHVDLRDDAGAHSDHAPAEAAGGADRGALRSCSLPGVAMLEQTRSRRPDIVTPRGILFFCSTKKLAGRSWPCYKMSMPLDFNTKKDAQNRKLMAFPWPRQTTSTSTQLIVEDDREHYGEQRFFAIGQL